MRLTQGTKVTIRDLGEAYFQQFVTDQLTLDAISKTQLQALVLLPAGTLKAVDFQDIKVAPDNRDNLLREFIEYAAENKVAPTDLVNQALKVVG
jgi:hypothetical protein